VFQKVVKIMKMNCPETLAEDCIIGDPEDLVSFENKLRGHAADHLARSSPDWSYLLNTSQAEPFDLLVIIIFDLLINTCVTCFVVSNIVSYRLRGLTGQHLRRVKSYDQIADQRQVPPCSRFYDLSQNPKVRPCLATNGALPCLRRNSKLWHPHAKRFLAPVELAACLGLPTFKSAAELAAVPMYPCREQYGMCDLGNAMHISCVGVILGIALACASDKKP
jgi:hypothetical protein